MAEQKAEQKEKEPEQPHREVIILKDKQARILLSLKADQEWYISSLAKATGTTYVHACRFLTACEAIGITRSERHGKIKAIKLTERGAKVAEFIEGIYGIMSQPQKKEPDQKGSKEAEKEKKEEKEK